MVIFDILVSHHRMGIWHESAIQLHIAKVSQLKQQLEFLELQSGIPSGSANSEHPSKTATLQEHVGEVPTRDTSQNELQSQNIGEEVSRPKNSSSLSTEISDKTTGSEASAKTTGSSRSVDGRPYTEGAPDVNEVGVNLLAIEHQGNGRQEADAGTNCGTAQDKNIIDSVDSGQDKTIGHHRRRLEPPDLHIDPTS